MLRVSLPLLPMPYLLASCLVLLPLTVAAQDGTLDPSFGMAGRVVTDLGGDDVLYALTLAPDGDLIAAGSTTDDAGNMDFVIVRYQSDGTQDSAFGDGGVVTFDLGGATGDAARAVAALADGRLLVGGSSRGAAGAAVLLRLTPDGALDPSFGDGGIVVVANSSSLYDLVVLDDGRIVVGGSAFTTDGEDVRSALALTRYLPDGQPDPTFGEGGRVATLFPFDAVALDLNVLSDGRLLATGYDLDFDLYYLAVARYLPNGDLDLSFSEDGRYTFPGVQTAGLEVFAIDDGKTLVVGADQSASALWRFLPDGRLDPAFGDGGTMATSNGFGGIGSPAAALDASGRLLVQVRPGIAAARFSTDGTLDMSFGTKGVAQAFPFGNTPKALLVQPDDRSILVGGSGPGEAGNEDFKLARLLAEVPTTDGEAPPSPAALRLDAYPNPAASASTVTFTLPTPADVTLSVYDVLGRPIETLTSGPMSAGTHHATWAPEGVPSGLYIVRLEAGEIVQTRRLVLAQ